MKKLLIVLGVLVLLAAAACAYWFGYQWHLDQRWRAAAERIEEAYAFVDVVTVEYLAGKQVVIHLDPVNRTAGIETKRYIPYVLIALELIGDEMPSEEATLALFNTIQEEARQVAGKHTKVILLTVSDTGHGYVTNTLSELHSAVEIRTMEQVKWQPLWWAAYPEELILFPGRADDP